MNLKISKKLKLKLKERRKCPVCKSTIFSIWNHDKSKKIKALECIKCTLVYMNKIIDKSHQVTFYNEYNYQRNVADKSKKNNRIRMYKIDFKYISNFISNNSNILDIGCGMGDFLNFFGKNTNKFGIELDIDAGIS